MTKNALLHALLILLLAVSSAPAADLPRIELAPGDVVHVSVLGRPDLTGDRRVAADGRISVHLLGRIDAGGRTAAELETAVTKAVETLTTTEESVTVEAVSYRPVYVTGEVTAPGAFGFRPGLSVRQAIALAGGVFRGPAPDDARYGFRLADEALKVRQLKHEIAGTLAVLARLEAEANGSTDLAPPPEITEFVSEELAAELLREQTEQMRMRAEALDRSVTAARRRGALAQSEADALAEQQALLQTRITESEDALARYETLLARGLTRTERLLDLKQDVSAYRTQAMSAAAFEARARQSAVDAEAEAARLPDDARRENLEGMIRLESELREKRVALAAAIDLLAQYGGLGAIEDAGAGGTIRYVLYRNDGGGREVGADTPLLPGDVLEVGILPGTEQP